MSIEDLTFSWPLLLLALGLLAIGLHAWSGRIRAVMLRSWPSQTLHLAPLYLGAALLLTQLAALAPLALGAVLLVLALMSFALGVLAVLWLPRPLTPRWLQEAPRWKDPV